MSSKRETPLEIFLNRHDDAAWRETLVTLLPAVHDAEDPAKLAQELLMQGKWFLKDQPDSSHAFLYGHRFWPEVKRAVARLAEGGEVPRGRTLAEVVREVARAAAA